MCKLAQRNYHKSNSMKPFSHRSLLSDQILIVNIVFPLSAWFIIVTCLLLFWWRNQTCLPYANMFPTNLPTAFLWALIVRLDRLIRRRSIFLYDFLKPQQSWIQRHVTHGWGGGSGSPLRLVASQVISYFEATMSEYVIVESHQCFSVLCTYPLSHRTQLILFHP